MSFWTDAGDYIEEAALLALDVGATFDPVTAAISAGLTAAAGDEVEDTAWDDIMTEESQEKWGAASDKAAQAVASIWGMEDAAEGFQETMQGVEDGFETGDWSGTGEEAVGTAVDVYVASEGGTVADDTGEYSDEDEGLVEADSEGESLVAGWSDELGELGDLVVGYFMTTGDGSTEANVVAVEAGTQVMADAELGAALRLILAKIPALAG